MLVVLRLLGGCLVLAAGLRLIGLPMARRLGRADVQRAGLLLGRAPRWGRFRSPPEPAGLPFALEVWAALLSAGEPAANAVGQAASCCAGAPARALLQVRAGLAAGLSTADAWTAALTDIESPTLTRAADTSLRSERDGTPLAPILRRLAAELRATAASRGVIAARRAGVLAVLPLGLCTLPAYVLLSVAPAVIGLIRHAR